MGATVKNIVGGVPRYQTMAPPTGKSLLAENRSITYLKPTDRIQNRILLFIHRIWQRVIQWLIPFSKTNYVGIVAGLDRNPTVGEIASLRPKEALSYLQRFLKGEPSSKGASECLKQLKEQYQAIEKGEKKIAGWVEKIKKLKTGESCVIVGNTRLGDEMFYLFTKEAGGIGLKVVGRGATMIRLSGVEEVAVAGEAKVVGSLNFGRVDGGFVQQLLCYSPLMTKGGSIDDCARLLEGRLVAEPNLLQNLTTQKTGAVFHLLLDVLKEVGKTKKETETDFERSRLRLDLFTLFSVMKEYRHTLANRPNEIQTAEKMLLICSRNLKKAHEEGVIGDNELKELVRELGEVRQIIDAALSRGQTPISRLKMKSMDLYQIPNLTSLAVPQPVVAVGSKKVENGRFPRLAPPASPRRKEEVVVRRVAQTAAPMPTPLRLRALAAQSTPQEIVASIYAIEFSPYTRTALIERAPNRGSDWWKYTPEQAKEMMGHLATLSKRLVDFSVAEKELPIDLYEALIKMSYMTVFLTHQTLNRGLFSTELTAFIGRINDFGRKVSARFHLDANRYGQCIHKGNVETNQELRNLYWTYLTWRSPTGAVSSDSLVWLERQVDLLSWVFPCHPGHGDELGGLGASIHGWIAPLPLPLLSAYHTLGMKLGKSDQKRRERVEHTSGPGWSTTAHSFYYTDSENRNTPEAITHDPRASLQESQETLVHDEFEKWREALSEMVKDPGAAPRSWSNPYMTGERAALKNSLYGQEERAERAKVLLKKQEEYLYRATQMGSPFSQGELTALLSLLRIECPQKEVIAFMKTHDHLFSNPAVRSFIQLILFHPSLIDTAIRFDAEAFCGVMPRFLNEKIVEYKERAKKQAADTDALIFFMQISERLKEIYTVLAQGSGPGDRAKYETTSFYPVQGGEMQEFLSEQRKKDPSSPAAVEMMALQLKALFAKPRLSQEELCQVILDMQLLKERASQVSSFDYRELFWIKGSYQTLMQEGRHALDGEHLQYVLDTLCHRKGLLLDESPWQGTFPLFANALYSVNLETGEIKDLATEAITTFLPHALRNDPLFKENFPDLMKFDVKAKLQTNNGVKIYSFEDGKKNPCRIEEKGGTYRLYRSFPKGGHPELLQAVSLAEGEEDGMKALFKKRDPEKKMGVGEMIKVLNAAVKKTASLPVILRERFFVDPKQPLKGYAVSPEGEVILAVNFEKKGANLKVKNVVDLREGSSSEAMQMVSLSEMDHPALKQLEQIEDPGHILVWGKKDSFCKTGLVEKVELPRYGLQFALKEGALVSTDPKYGGYRVVLEASVERRKGFPFSLLLEHPDPSRPKKLILPSANAIVEGANGEPPHRGLAYLIWVIKTYLTALFYKSAPDITLSHCFQISGNMRPVTIDLRPHTEEFIYAPGTAREQSQQLIAQSMKLGHYERAVEVLQSVEIEKEERALDRWISFTTLFDKGAYSSAVALKIYEKILAKIDGQKKYEKTCEWIHRLEKDAFKAYLTSLKELTAPLRLSRETFDRIAEQIKKEDPTYYQKQIAPYFLKVGEAWTIPVSYTDGRTTPLPPLMETAAQARREKLSELQQLEEVIRPGVQVAKESVAHQMELLKTPVPLLFEPAAVAKYFSSAQVLTAGPELLKKVVRPKLESLKKEKRSAEERLKALLTTSKEPLDQLAIYSKNKRTAELSDLLTALLQNDLEGLRKRDLLPRGTDLGAVKRGAIDLFDLEVRLQQIKRSEAELSQMLTQKGKIGAPLWDSKSKALWEQLLYRRQYDPARHPELLAFEAFQFVTFRNSNRPSQLELLQELVRAPAAIVQAGTGTGKSSVLSVLRALMRANGTNLVTQKVLPHLYAETLAILQGRLGGTFKRKVYPFLFKQSMPIYDKEGNSLFESVYRNLLETIQNKGCVLTDYKSFVLLEQKFIALSRQLLGYREQRIEPPSISVTHWNYLAKILVLLRNRDDQLMDEFDQPLSAVQRIQTQLAQGPLFPRWMIDESLALYDLLLEDKELLLTANLQGDLPPATRQKCIERAAQRVAAAKARGSATTPLLTAYLLGQSEELLPQIEGWPNEEKDQIAFLKEQFTTYLPLTLSRSSVTHYTRSKDGKKIVTCSKGEARDAKFGNPIEEINYSIQDYEQQKVALSTFRDWVIDSKKDCIINPEGAEERFQEIVPRVSLKDLIYLAPDDLEDRVVQLHAQINQNPVAVRFFLKRHLEGLRSSGVVISMNPQDIVAMSRTVSGVSATTGSLGSLHKQFERDLSKAEEIQAALIARLRSRSFAPPIRYQPLQPLEVLKQVSDQRFCALIDGNGAFRSIAPRRVAEHLMAANPSLKRVEYYETDGTLSWIGDPKASLSQKGFYFPQAQTRGSDQVLRPDGLALMTASEKGTIEDFIQEEGRMRHPQQKVLVALSQFTSPTIRSLDDLLAHKKQNEKGEHGEDRYRAEIQRLRQMMRHAAREELLRSPDLPHFLDRFKQLEPLFVASTLEEEDPGIYFRKNHRVIHRTADPVAQLRECQHKLIQEATLLGIATQELASYNVEELRPHLPPQVLPLSNAEEQQQEVQEELEVNNEIETEQQQESETQVVETKVASYLPRLSTSLAESAAQIHPAFDPRIFLTDSYLPRHRTDPLHKRKPFDDRTSRIGPLVIHYERQYVSGWGLQPSRYDYKIERLTIEDLLDEVDIANRDYSRTHFRYDLRAKQVTRSPYDNVQEIINSPEFHTLIAQVKFLDGMTDGYTDEELGALSGWLRPRAQEMKRYFSGTILKYRPESRFPHSQLWKLFETLSA